MLSFWENMPIWLRIITALVGLGGLLIGGFLLYLFIAMVTYARTDEFDIAEVSSGVDKLVIRRVVERNVGSTSVSYRLYWNGRLVSDYNDSDSAGQPYLDLPADPDDRRGLVVRSVADTTGSWTVWVNPAKFSRAEFGALADCLDRQQASLWQQVQRKQPADEYPSAMLRPFTPVRRLIYGARSAPKTREYTYKQAGSEESRLTLVVQPNGVVMLQPAQGVTEAIGRLLTENGQRVVEWRYPQYSFLLSRDLPKFKNRAGQTFTDRYALQQAADHNPLFFREGPRYIESVYVAESYDRNTDNRPVEGHLVDRKFHILYRSHNAGQIVSATDGKPVFEWLSWPDHPLTEADLRQFRDEQGRPLTDFYELRAGKENAP